MEVAIMQTIRTWRNALRRGLLDLGYQVDCIRSIPKSLLNPRYQRHLEFEDVACRLMVGFKRPVTFMQIGAFDGVTKDPLYPFIEDHDWTGVLVEPQSRACDQLRELHRERAGIRIVQCAISDIDGEAVLYRVEKDPKLPDWCGGLASFSRESIEKHESIAPGIIRAIVEETVPTLTFASLFETLGSTVGPDILQIDTEGFDAQILEWFPFDEFKPAIVHFERKHLDVANQEETLTRLASFGYRFAPSGEEDMLAVLR